MVDEFAVLQTLARYVRAADRRDGEAMAALFLSSGAVEICQNRGGSPLSIGRLEGRPAIASAVADMMKPHTPMGWSHHTTHDHIVSVDGDSATIDAQFITFETVGAVMPEGGWPTGAKGAQGTVSPIEAGYYRPTLKRVEGRWYIETMQIVLDLPMAQ